MTTTTDDEFWSGAFERIAADGRIGENLDRLAEELPRWLDSIGREVAALRRSLAVTPAPAMVTGAGLFILHAEEGQLDLSPVAAFTREVNETGDVSLVGWVALAGETRLERTDALEGRFEYVTGAPALADVLRLAESVAYSRAVLDVGLAQATGARFLRGDGTEVVQPREVVQRRHEAGSYWEAEGDLGGVLAALTALDVAGGALRTGTVAALDSLPVSARLRAALTGPTEAAPRSGSTGSRAVG